MSKQVVSLIGAPTDVGAGTPGARMGPEALRVAGIASAIAQFDFSVIDCGNVSGPPNPGLPPIDGFRHLDEVVAWNRSLCAAVYAELAAERAKDVRRADVAAADGADVDALRQPGEVAERNRAHEVRGGGG